MKRRSFLKKSVIATGAAMSATGLKANPIPGSEKEFYELKVYQLTSEGGKKHLKEYYTKAVIPFLNERGAKVGVFNEYSLEDPPKLYVLQAHQSTEAYFNALQEMKTNQVFLDAAKNYMELPSEEPVFERYETFLMEAFDAIPQLKTPPVGRGILELRTYESYNEDAGHRKVKMFNKEELPLFEEVGLHPVFFGQLVAGRFMPALTYMLWFKDLEEREANWDKFVNSDKWKTMKAKEEYANTVSKVKRVFLTPAGYSQI